MKQTLINKIIYRLQAFLLRFKYGAIPLLTVSPEAIIIEYIRNNATIMYALRAFQYDFFNGRDLGWNTTWRTIYSAKLGEYYTDSFPIGWYPKAFDLEAFKAVPEKYGIKVAIGEDH
jgi:hypothetical protein